MITPDREINPHEYKECSCCEGKGTLNKSECCGEELTDSGLCMMCRDHAGESECDECEGTGTVAF